MNFIIYYKNFQLLGEISDERLHIHHGDILKMNIKDLWTKANVSRVDWLTAPPALHIIGNLPFNIATPLIIKYFKIFSKIFLIYIERL